MKICIFFNKQNQQRDTQKDKEKDVELALDCALKKAEGNMSKYKAARRQASQKQDLCTSFFKANVIHQVDEGFSQNEVAEHFRISQSQVSRRIAKRQEIMWDASQKHQKLLRKDKKPKNYVELYKVLWGKFKEARAKKYRVNFHGCGPKHDKYDK